MIIINSDLRGFWVWRRGSHYTELLRPDGKWQRVVEGLDYLPTVLKTTSLTTSTRPLESNAEHSGG